MPRVGLLSSRILIHCTVRTSCCTQRLRVTSILKKRHHTMTRPFHNTSQDALPVNSVNAKKDNTQKDSFLNVFPTLVKDVLDALPPTMPKEGIEWFKRNMNYNVPFGKLNRGLMVPTTLELLKGQPLEKHELFKAQVLGWCIEWLQAFFLVADDVVDASVTRRGQPCYYRLPNIGLIATNDSMLLESSIFLLLKKYFRQDACYVDLLELFHETIFQTELGQLMDLVTGCEGVDLNKFSIDRYLWIVEYKTAYYSFYLPVAAGMHLAGIATPSLLETAKSVLIPLGKHFQVQDDYLDCYGDPEHIGKIGTDIEDNKCSWVVNTALKRCTTEQRKVLDENYGRKEKECVDKVKQVFREVNIQEIYKHEEEESLKKVQGLMEHVEHMGLRKVLDSFVKKIYGRQK